MIYNCPLRSLAIALLMFFVCAPSMAEENPYERNLYAWDGLDGSYLALVPPSQLEEALALRGEVAPQSLGLSPDDWKIFVRSVNYKRPDGRQRCSFSTTSSAVGFSHPDRPAPKNPPKITAMDIVRAETTTIVGVIEGEMASWFFGGLVTTVKFVRIEEVLRDESGTFEVGQLATFSQGWGSFDIRGKTLCTYAPEGIHHYEIGERFVVSGSLSGWNEGHLETGVHTKFAVNGDTLESPPRVTHLFTSSAMTLTEVRRQAQAAGWTR